MAKFQFKPTLGDSDKAFTSRFGAGTGSGNNWTDTEAGKIVKLVGDSRYDLATVGDGIEGFVLALQGATLDGYTIGTVQDEGNMEVTFNGLQATEGTGAIAVGDYVLAATVVAKGTALTTKPKVVKATTQTGQYFAWRVTSLGTAGTGAVGTTGLITRVNS